MKKIFNSNKNVPPFLGGFLCALVFLFFLISCRDSDENIVHKIPIEKKISKTEIQLLEENRQKLIEKIKGDFLIFEKDTFYAFPFLNKSGIESIIFSDGKKLTPLGDSLLELFDNDKLFGLEKDFFGYDTIISLLQTAKTGKDLSHWLELELRLSEALLNMAKTIRYGYFFNDTTRVPFGYSFCDSTWKSQIIEAIHHGNIQTQLSHMFPKNGWFNYMYKQYRIFLSEWERYSDFPNYPGDSISSDSLRAYLLNRFALTGELDTISKEIDSVRVAKALKIFQKKWNLEPDGKPGKYTRMALSLSKKEWLWQIQMALDRYKHEPENWPKKFIWLNIPSADFILFDFENKKFLNKETRKKKLLKLKKDKLKEDTIALYSRVVVGKPETPTPLLEGKINEMIIYPYWNVPFKIATEEILPMVQKDTGYLRKKNFEVIGASGKVIENPGKLPWKRYNKEYFPVRIRQRIGVDNSLGVVKFNFHNPFGVYLHDTNSKRYFKTFYRFQSHGCMRVEKFEDLARYLIREDTLKIPFDTLSKWLTQPEQRKIRIKHALFLKVRYYTFVADTEWTGYRYYLDIYGLDARRYKRLFGR